MPANVPGLTLDECLSEAMANNRRRAVSKYAVALAEAQHRQALAAYWPQISLGSALERRNVNPNFVFPSRDIPVPAQSVSIPMGGSIPITIPGVGTVNSSSIEIPAQTIMVPVQEVDLSDRDSARAAVSAAWLLYDGGMRSGLREQGQAVTDLMKQQARRTDLEIVDSVKRLYYAAVLARQLHQVGQETIARMEATLELTESLYKQGGGKVKKTDFLDAKIMVESLRSMVALLERNEEMSRSALANTMGRPWNVVVFPSAKEIPFSPIDQPLEQLVNSAFRFSPDWKKMEAAARAIDGSARSARSGYHPKLALVGDLHQWWNESSSGMATARNKQGWTIGIGLEIPIFDGFLTRNKIAAAKAQADKLSEEQFLLKDGIGLQIKDAFLGLNAAQKAHGATLEAFRSSEESRDLNTRAYQNDLVETEKVIRSQLMEALMSAQHLKTRFDHAALRSQLDLLVGSEVLARLDKTP